MNSHHDITGLQDIYSKLAAIVAKIQSHLPDLNQFDTLINHYNDQLANYQNQFFKGDEIFQVLCSDLYSKSLLLTHVMHGKQFDLAKKISFLKEYLVLVETALTKCIDYKLPEEHQHVSNFFGVKTFSLTTILLNFKNNAVPQLTIMLEQMQVANTETHLNECVTDCENLVKEYKPEPAIHELPPNEASLAETAKLRRDNLLLTDSLTQSDRLIEVLRAKIIRLESQIVILSNLKKPPAPNSGNVFFQLPSGGQPITTLHPARCPVNS